MPNGANITPDQIIPLWYGFYHKLSRERTSYTTVTYSPVIDAKPVDIPILGSFAPDLTYSSSDCLERDDGGLHLQTHNVMVPYFFVTDRQNNARWTPFYTADVVNLTDEV